MNDDTDETVEKGKEIMVKCPEVNKQLTQTVNQSLPRGFTSDLESRGIDQLCGHRAADLRLCFPICKKQVFSCVLGHVQEKV